MNKSFSFEDPFTVSKTAIAGERKKNRTSDFFAQNRFLIDYCTNEITRRFLSPEGKILPSRRTNLVSANQRKMSKAIKRARLVGILPYISTES